MASENCVICLVRAMDKLWFHQMILYPKHYSFLFPDIAKTYTQPHTGSPDYLSENTSQSTCVITCQETSPVPSVIILNNSAQREKTSIQRRDGNEDITQKTRMARKDQSRNTRSLDLSTKILQKTMSWKSSGELELEEVKGFMDLGFTFKKENMNIRIMSLIPGLQRIQAYKNYSSNLKLLIDDYDYGTEQDEEEVEETNGVMRPYLSEAWLIERPESPLLNLRIPRVSTAANMKKHLKFWARMVASAIHPESR